MEVSSSTFCWKSFIRTFSASLKVTSLHEYKSNGQLKRRDFLTRCNLSCSIWSDCSGFFNGPEFVIIPSLEPWSGFGLQISVLNYHCKWSGRLNPRFPPCRSKRSKGDQDICNNGAASPPFTGRWLLAMLLFNMLRYSSIHTGIFSIYIYIIFILYIHILYILIIYLV